MDEKQKRISIHARRKQRLFEKYDGKCIYCGSQLTEENYTVNHIVPKVLGGSKHAMSNKMTCCEKCNHLKDHLTLEQFREFFASYFSNFTNEKFKFYFKKVKILIVI